MEEIKIFGHKSPDVDAIMSAYVTAYMYNKVYNENAKAYRLGEYNKEVKYIIDRFNFDLDMDIVDSFPEGSKVIMTDHNEYTQSIDNIDKLNIIGLYDHHKIGKIATDVPMTIVTRPWGSTCTVLYDILKHYDVDRNIKIMMLCGMLSDTLILKSPTTTKFDIDAVYELSNELNIDYNELGLGILKAGADLSDLTSDELISVDTKVFDLNGIKSEINQVNCVDFDNILSRKNDIIDSINNKISKDKLKLFIFVVTDVVNCNSKVVVLGEKKNLFEKAFNVTLVNDECFIEGLVSRKKQVVPPLMEVTK